MRLRPYLSSVALIALVTASAALSPQAMAQKGTSLTPSTQWAVSRVPGGEQGGAYCAVAQRFRPNTILTIARNDGGEASFALDFQASRFTPDMPMQVILDPGAGQQRAFDVTPLSSQAFVVRLGEDRPFFDAIDHTGHLRVEFGEESYNFDLSEIETGQTKLDNCVSSLASLAETGGAPMASATSGAADGGLSQEISSLREQIRELQTRSKAPSHDNDDDRAGSLAKRIAALETENRDLQAKLEKVQAEVTIPVRSPEDVRAIENLQGEKALLEEKLELSKNSKDQADDLAAQIDQLKEDNARLKDASASAAAINEGSIKFRDETISELKADNERLAAQLSDKEGAVKQGEELRAKLSGLEADNEKLRQELAAAADNPDLKRAAMEIDTLKEENYRLQDMVSAREKQGMLISEMESHIQDLETRNTKLLSDLKAAEEKFKSNDKTAELGDLQDQIRKMSADMDGKDRKLVELSQLSLELEELKTANADLQQKLIEADFQQTDSEGLRQKIAELEDRNTDLLQQIQDAAEKAVSQDNERISALNAENEKLRKELEGKHDVVAQLEEAQQEITSLREENAKLVAQIETAAGEDDGMAAQLQAALGENKNLKEALAQRDSEAGQIPTLRAEIDRLTREKAQLASVQNSTPPQEEVMNALRAENDDLRGKLEAMAGKDGEIAELKRRIEEQKARISDMEADARRADAALKAAQADAELGRSERIQSHKYAQASQVVSDAINVVGPPAPEKEKPKPPAAPPVAAAPPPKEPSPEELLKPADAPAASSAAPAAAPQPDVVPVVEEDTAPSEAEMHEEALKQQIQAPPPVQTEAAVPVKAPEEDLSARKSEDPYAAIPAQDDFKGYAAGDSAAKEAAPDVAAVPQQVEQTSLAPETAHAPSVYKPSFEVTQVLSGADISPAQGVAVVAGASGPGRVSYQWMTDNIFGSAIQEPLPDEAAFDEQVKNYLEVTKSRCAEDFAIVPDETVQNGSTRIDTYEVACVGKNVNSSAAIVFFSKDGTFTAMAHEAPTDRLGTAMDLKDRLFRSLRGS